MVFGIIIGLLAGGAAMYYIQPSVKIAVARAFGYEPQLIAAYQDLIAKLKSSPAK